MDSNFQVRISANIADLQRSIKEAQATLRELKGVADTTSESFNKMGANANKVGAEMNRARLATFAFGQVVRDAGFFSQSFGLGVLAISNNIPILIDQLVLLSGVSAGFGMALSLMGSLLAAAATVFAYWAQGVERDGGTVSGAINKMANDSESSLGKLIKYLSTPPASEMLGKAAEGVRQGMEAIKKIIDAGVKLAIAIWERFGPTVMFMLDRFFSMAKNVMLISLNLLRLAAAIVQGDWTKALSAIGNIGKLVFNNLLELAQGYIKFLSERLGGFVSLFDPLKGAMIQAAGMEVIKLGDSFKFASEDLEGFNFNLLELVNDLFKVTKSTKDAGKETETYASIMAKLSDELESIDYTFTGTFGDRQEARIKAMQSAIESLRKIGFEKTSKAVKDLSTEMDSLLSQQQALDTKQNPLRVAGVVSTAGGLAGAGRQITDEEAAAALKKLEDLNRQANFMKQFNEDTNQANESVTALVRTVGNDLVNSFMTMMETGRFSFESIGQALLGMIKRLVAAAAAAAVLSVILSSLFPGAGNTSFKDIFKGISGIGIGGGLGVASSPSVGTITTSGINTSINSSNAMSAGGGVLETRVSGNDLVILLDRASNNRNKYF